VAFEELTVQLGSTDWVKRVSAAQRLGECKDSRAVEPLTARLGDRDQDVRRAACEALRKLGDARSVEPLIAQLGDKGSQVRQAACEALERLGEGALARAALAAPDGDTESISELGRLAAAGYRRARQVLGTTVADSLCQSDDRVHQKAAKAVLKALKPWLGEMLCSGCLARLHPDRATCRVCDRAANLVFEVHEVVAVLDGGWAGEQASADGVLRVNWLKRRAVFDFDRVEIVAAADEEVERFLIQVGNDTEEWRQPRYRRMHCAVAPQCVLSENTLRILRSTFGEVVRA